MTNQLVDRIKILQQYADEDPGDPFNQYALALEYLKSNTTEARRLFQKLVAIHPDYLPTYYPYAQLLFESKEQEQAELIFQRGMEVARAKGDMKTLRELQSAHQDLLYGG